MGNVLKSVDKVGTEIGFNFGRKPRFQTCLGGVMTLIAYLFIALVTWIFADRLFFSNEPEVSVSESFGASFPKINLFNNNFYPILGIIGEQGLIDADRFLEFVTVGGIIIKSSFTSIEAQDFSHEVLKHFSFLPCKEIADNAARDTLYKSSVHSRILVSFMGFALI